MFLPPTGSMFATQSPRNSLGTLTLKLFDETASFLVDKESGNYQVIQVPVTYAQDPNHKKDIIAIVDLCSSMLRAWRTAPFKFHLFLMTMTITVTITIAPWN